MKKILLSLLFISVSLDVTAGGRGDDPLLTKVMIGQLETRSTNGSNPTVLEAQAWIGKDLDKLWIKADAEWVNGKAEEVEMQFLYSKAIAPYWDFQIGWRHDNLPTPRQDWLAIGFQGIAPYFFEIDGAAFLGESGQVGLRLDAEYEMMFTQKLILTPEATFNFHSKNDASRNIGSGLSSSQIGLRLRYELTREFAPYIGVNWINKYGKTGDYVEAAGGNANDTQWVVGLRAWF